MLSAAERLAAEVGNDTAERPKSRRAPANGEFRIFDAANRIDTISVLDRLGISHEQTNRGEMATCPGCGEHDSLVCKDGGLKCLHDRCAQAGPVANPGFRTNVDLVMAVQSVDKIAAAKLICEWFNIEIPNLKGTKKTSAEAPRPDDYTPSDSDAPDAPPAFEVTGVREPAEQPTAAEPLRGLVALQAVAVRGRAALLARAAEPVIYVWQDIAVAGTVVTSAGSSGCGKTTFNFMLMIARATLGEPVRLLGRIVTPAPVGQHLVLIEGEHSEGSAARILVRAAALLDVDDAALDRVILVARKAVKLRSREWHDVERMIRAGLVSDVLVDTIARIAPGDANSEAEQVAIFDEVAKAIELAPDGGLPKPMFWLVAHTRKNATTGNMNDVSGSGQRVAQSDSVLMFTAEKVDGQVTETTVLFDKLREPPDEHPKPVSFSIVREDDGTRRLVTDLAPGKAETDSRPAEVRIVEFLESHTDPQTKEEIRKALRLSGAKVEDAISNLFQSRSIRKRFVKRRTGEYPGFYVAPQAAPPEEF